MRGSATGSTARTRSPAMIPTGAPYTKAMSIMGDIPPRVTGASVGASVKGDRLSTRVRARNRPQTVA